MQTVHVWALSYCVTGGFDKVPTSQNVYKTKTELFPWGILLQNVDL